MAKIKFEMHTGMAADMLNVWLLEYVGLVKGAQVTYSDSVYELTLETPEDPRDPVEVVIEDGIFDPTLDIYTIS